MCALRYLLVSFKLMAIAEHKSQHNFAQFSSSSHILAWISWPSTTFAVSFTTLDTA